MRTVFFEVLVRVKGDVVHNENKLSHFGGDLFSRRLRRRASNRFVIELEGVVEHAEIAVISLHDSDETRSKEGLSAPLTQKLRFLRVLVDFCKFAVELEHFVQGVRFAF